MNATRIADIFRDALAAVPALSAVRVATQQSQQTVSRPSIVLEVTARALSGSGRACTFELRAFCESDAERRQESDPEPAETHASLVQLVRDTFLGAGRAALLAAVNAEGTFDFRGWAGIDVDPALDGNHFRTPVAIAGTALAL